MKFFREPLLHFVLGGALLFGVVHWMSPARNATGSGSGEPVHIGSGEVAWMQETWTKQWQRPATRDELIGAVTNFLKEELLAREARSMGLEKDDTLVRRRLGQKLSFLLEDTFRMTRSPDGALESYFAANADRYRTHARITFRHVYFDPEKRQDATADARAALEHLKASADGAPVDDLGDRLLVEPVLHDAEPQAVAAQFGGDFADAIFKLKAGSWEGPVTSAYGVHLVRIEAITPPEAIVFADARAKVEEDWYREQQKKQTEEFFTKLMTKYKVEIDPDVRGMVGPLDELLPQSIGGAGETQ